MNWEMLPSKSPKPHLGFLGYRQFGVALPKPHQLPLMHHLLKNQFKVQRRRLRRSMAIRRSKRESAKAYAETTNEPADRAAHRPSINYFFLFLT